MDRETVGFVGLGVMGRPMAENLAKRYRVRGFDTQPERWKGAVGVEPAPLESVAGCAVVFLSLPSVEVVERVLGATGLAPQLRPGSLVIDLSTGLPAVSRAVADDLGRRRIAYIDAPVSGGEAGARAATLSVMVGASPDVFSRALPYLKVLGTTVIRAGDVGAGSVAKLVNNMIVGVAFTAIAEAFALAVSNGLEPEALHRALRGGWAGSPVLEVCGPAIALGQYVPGGTVDMIAKDLGYAALLATQSGVKTPMAEAARELFQEAQKAGWGTESQPAVFKLWSAAGAPS